MNKREKNFLLLCLYRCKGVGVNDWSIYELLPLYFMVALMQFIGIMMWDNETISYVRDTSGAIAQMTFILYIPNHLWD